MRRWASRRRTRLLPLEGVLGRIAALDSSVGVACHAGVQRVAAGHAAAFVRDRGGRSRPRLMRGGIGGGRAGWSAVVGADLRAVLASIRMHVD
jgi:hypothetical protein